MKSNRIISKINYKHTHFMEIKNIEFDFMGKNIFLAINSSKGMSAIILLYDLKGHLKQRIKLVSDIHIMKIYLSKSNKYIKALIYSGFDYGIQTIPIEVN